MVELVRGRQEELRLGAVLAHALRFQDAVQSLDAAKHLRGGDRPAGSCYDAHSHDLDATAK